MNVFMVDGYFNEVDDVELAEYVYIEKGSVDDFVNFLEDNKLGYGSLTEDSWHYWSDGKWQFETLYKEDLIKELNGHLPKTFFDVDSITKTTKTIKTNKTNEFNLIIKLNNGIAIQTNTEPCTLDEIFEALKVLQKPSILGKQVKEYRIERVQ